MTTEETITAQPVATKHKRDEAPSMTFKVGENDYRLINEEDHSKLETLLTDMENYVKTTDGSNASEDERNEMWSTANGMWKDYSKTLVTSELGFWLTRAEYNYITDLILHKMEYDVNTVFVAIQLGGFFAELHNTFGELSKDAPGNTPINFKITANDVTYLYHLISTNKVKGLTKQTYCFAEILRKIGALSKVINHYDGLSKDYWTMIADWTASYTPLAPGDETL
jgi:hypothetical protein